MSSVPVQKSVATLIATDEAKMRQVGQLYHFRDAEVTEFLAQYPPRLDLLLAAYAQVEKHFGARPHITLRLTRDPEWPTPPELVASIQTHQPVESAHAALFQFDDWFLKQPDDVAGPIIFDLEFM